MQMHVKLCLFLIIEMEYVIQDGKPHSEENIYFLNVVFFLFCQHFYSSSHYIFHLRKLNRSELS